MKLYKSGHQCCFALAIGCSLLLAVAAFSPEAVKFIEDDDTDDLDDFELMDTTDGFDGPMKRLPQGNKGDDGDQGEGKTQEAQEAQAEAEAEEAAAAAKEPFPGLDPWTGPENEVTLVRFFHGLYYQRQYRWMNNYLVDQVNTTEFEANMRQLAEWLEYERSRGVNLFKNRATVDALEQVLALRKIEGVCNRHSHAILWRNDRAVGGLAHRRPSRLSKSPRRIVWLIHHVALKHAVQCHYKYPENFVELYAKLDTEQLARVEAYIDAIIDVYLESQNRVSLLMSSARSKAVFEPGTLVQAIKTLSGPKQARVAFQLIKQGAQAAGDPDHVYLHKVVDEKRGQFAVNREKVAGLLHKYLVEPCHYYQQRLGPDVFVPATYEAQMLEPEDRGYQALASETTDAFQNGWIRYRLCQLLVNKEEAPLARELESLADKEPIFGQ